MERQRKWQLALILTVIAITIYNVLPTVFYYLQPLKSPVSPEAAMQIAASAEDRTSSLNEEAHTWLSSFCKQIQTSPLSISQVPENPGLISVSFSKEEEALRFRQFLPRAGSLIPFAPAQLALAAEQDPSSKTVLVCKRLPFSLDQTWFSYVAKNDPAFLSNRMTQVALSATQPEDHALFLYYLERGSLPFFLVESICDKINAMADAFEDKDPLAIRYASSLIPDALDTSSKRAAAVQTLIASIDQARDALRNEKHRLLESGKDSSQTIALLELKEKNLLNGEIYLKKYSSRFSAERSAWNPSSVQEALSQSMPVDLSKNAPFFSSLSFDAAKDKLKLTYLPEVAQRLTNHRFEQILLNEAAKIGRTAKEELIPEQDGISIPLHRNPSASGYLVFDQKKALAAYSDYVTKLLKTLWHPQHPDLQTLTWTDAQTYPTLTPQQQTLCILIGSPATSEVLHKGKSEALYTVVKGVGKIAKTYEAFPESNWAEILQSDIRSLAAILYQQGFIGHASSAFPSTLITNEDLLFENTEAIPALLEASREEFLTRAAGNLAYIELGNVEQRILVENKIETQIHEDLLKWQDDYLSSRVSLNPATRFEVPKPTKSTFWSNLVLSAKKYFRGDERKIIRWGLDLSGGKTVQIELKDANQQTVLNEEDLKQAINELYDRVNKMGVSEVSIRQIGHQIVLDFPGSQAMSASELIQASTMAFHVVNEKYSLYNSDLAGSVNRFLQEVWNEALVSGRQDAQSLHAIAVQRLHPKQEELRSEAARILWESGLRLEAPSHPSHAIEEGFSKIARFRGNKPSDWHYQSHPLLIVFRNSALEGANLKNIHSGYDPSKGNFLSFEITDPQAKDALFSWTSKYSKETVAGTELAKYTPGRGWRMAAILNDMVINSPTLDSPLRDSAMISGSFSQREASQLSADLKAGSLTFTPHILSEKNVSPELGHADKVQGIAATCAALILVVISMLAYYRFAGLVASAAVLLNLLIIWATLQNLGAALTLAGLAGIILTVGMAVDANVLVFERVKEEFERTQKIGSALSAGYQKAYSAIIDSNITTIIAALILLNFDAGPVKSFAVNLIIGIASSMFTALFVTRFYFTGWARNPKNTALKMANWIRSTQFPFLKWSKTAFALSLAVICIGASCLISYRSSILGMDFTGGYALNLELENKNMADVEEALLSAGASKTDFQIRQLDTPSHLRILFGTSMEMEGKPFSRNANFENSARIDWTVAALEKAGIFLTEHALSELKLSWAAMSGQVSESMRNNAIIGLLISFFCIFVYLAFRFEYKFATAALLGLVHDVFITFGSIGLLYLFGVQIQIDLNTIAALMLVIGYSLNDTIIIFDRIREEMANIRKRNISEIVNHALNATLGRTAITSGTTLVVLIALTALGGSSIFHFALIMTIGVFLGTLSSWFVVCPLMIFFHRKEEVKSWKSISI